MSELKEYTLGNIASVQTGPFGSQLHMKDYVLIGTPIVTVEHLGENHIVHNNLPLVSDSDKERLSKYILTEGDIVFSRVGSVDRRAYVSQKENGWLFSGRCLRVRVNSPLIDPRFLSYYFGQETFKEHIRGIAVGATMPSINTQILSGVKIIAPSQLVQKTIADILASLDDKIDLLHLQNTTLEQMADTLYRRWLSTLEGRPESTLGEIVRVQSGYAFKSGDFREEGTIGVLKITNITMGNVETNHTQYIPPEIAATVSPKFRVHPGAYLIAMTGAEIGKIGIVGDVSKELWLNQRVGMLVDKVGYGAHVGYLALKSDEGQDYITNTASGSAQENISASSIEAMPLPRVTEEELRSFGDVLEPFLRKMQLNLGQALSLANLRDTLLPKIMSGALRIQPKAKTGEILTQKLEEAS